MSTDISKSDVANFFVKNYHTNKLSADDVKKLGIDVEKYDFADTNDDNAFDIDEIANVHDFYAAITDIIEKDRDALKVKDEEKDKAEKNKIQKKGDADNK